MDDLSAARDLLRIVTSHTHFLTSPRRRLRRQLAAAGLARCCALLEGMAILVERDRDDVVGVLLRPLYEAWLVATYLILKGKDFEDDAALMQVLGDSVKWNKALAEGMSMERLGASITEFEALMAEHGFKPKALRYDHMAIELDQLLIKAGERKARATDLYNQLYRTESTYGSHGNLGTFSLHLDFDDDVGARDSIRLKGHTVHPLRIRLGALLTLQLARRVFSAFSVVVRPPLDTLESQFSDEEPSQREPEGVDGRRR